MHFEVLDFYCWWSKDCFIATAPLWFHRQQMLRDLDPCQLWQDPHSLTYICTCCVLMSSLPFTSYLKSHKCELPEDTFLVHSSHNCTPKRNELRYHCCLSQLYFIWH
jgi:hypothetical protein